MKLNFFSIKKLYLYFDLGYLSLLNTILNSLKLFSNYFSIYYEEKDKSNFLSLNLSLFSSSNKKTNGSKKK